MLQWRTSLPILPRTLNHANDRSKSLARLAPNLRSKHYNLRAHLLHGAGTGWRTIGHTSLLATYLTCSTHPINTSTTLATLATLKQQALEVSVVALVSCSTQNMHDEQCAVVKVKLFYRSDVSHRELYYKAATFA